MSESKMTTHYNSNSIRRPNLRLPFSQHRQTNVMLLKNNQRATKHPQAFPMLGELPSLAGLLLYPGKREKMVTTTESAFGPKTCPMLEPKKILQCSLTLDGDQCFITTNREDYPAYTLDGTPIVWQNQAPVRKEMSVQEQRSSLYQHDFPAPKKKYFRRNQIVPHPDNLAINTALRQVLK
nr:uncharacterized protein si:dkeyp-69c1.9 [Misgurnus anguillicaudatus]